MRAVGREGGGTGWGFRERCWEECWRRRRRGREQDEARFVVGDEDVCAVQGVVTLMPST